MKPHSDVRGCQRKIESSEILQSRKFLKPYFDSAWRREPGGRPKPGGIGDPIDAGSSVFRIVEPFIQSHDPGCGMCRRTPRFGAIV
jgi:hypothetical protein